MATYTPNYNLNKPTYSEEADIRTINNNMDAIDEIMHSSQVSIAPAYDPTATYSEGDMVMYELLLYTADEDIDTPETFDPSKWTRAYAAKTGAGIVYPQDATKYLNGVGQWTVPAGGGGGGVEPIREVLFDTPQSTSSWSSPILISCNPLDYDLITFEVDDGQGTNALLTFEPHSTEEDTSAGDYTKGYKLVSGSNAYVNRTSNAVGFFTATGTTLTLNKVVGYRFCGALQPVIYSTEEREIGVWVDNKPLYQKSYLNIGTVTSYTFTDLTDIESIRIVEGASECNNGIPFQYVHPNTANVVGGFFDLTGTNPVLEIRRGGDASGTSLEVLTVQYTKTTDTAGSGSYNTLGVPTVHYSTNEQVVGTWIDGSTIYEKTVVIAVANDSSSVLPINSNETVVKIDGYLTRSEDNSQIFLPFNATNLYCRLYSSYSLYGGVLFESNMTGTATVTIRYIKSV